MPLQDNLLAPHPPWFPDALAAIGRHAFLTASQIASAVTAHRDDVVPVLQNLVKNGLLQMLVPTHCPGKGAVEAAFVLSRIGIRVLRSMRERATVRLVRADKSRYTLAHDLLRNELAMVFELLDRQGHLRLERWETTREKIAAVGYVEDKGVRRRVPLVADALAVLEVQDRSTAFLVEIDMGTVGIERMRAKYRGYLSWFHEDGPVRRFGTKSMRVLTVAPTDTRISRLREAAIDATGGRGSGFLWFLPEAAIDASAPEKILGHTCMIAKPGDPKLERLFP